MRQSRLDELRQYILAKDFVSMEELRDRFHVSINTVRRDVDELVRANVLYKVYGGVRPVLQSSSFVIPFTDRKIKKVSEKSRICAVAAQLVANGDVIFIDSGTTTLYLPEQLVHVNGLTVLTNNTYVIMHCLDKPNINLISFGGQLIHSTASFSSNFSSLDQIRFMNINKAFMAATGISIERGATNNSPVELEIKRKLVSVCDKCYLLVDSSKFDKSALMTYAKLEAFTGVVTDKLPSARYLEHFKKMGIQLYTQ